VSPTSNQVFTPNSTITIETTSKINDSTLSQLRIAGTQNDYFNTDTASIPLLRQISKTGNTYKHQYIWKNAKEGVYNLNVGLYDGETSSAYAGVTVIIAEPRIIKIFSLKNGQEFEEGKPIKISVDATDAKGIVVQDELELIVDGKSKTTVYNAWKYGSESPNNMILDKDYGSNLSELEKGTHTIQIIARQKNYSGDGAILGKSEIITIRVK
jgi:Bacterial Ig domain